MTMPLLRKYIAVFFTGIIIYALTGCQEKTDKKTGLIGIYYSEADLESPKGITYLDSLYQRWDETVDFQSGSSAEWKGYLTGPVTGNVTLTISTTTKVELKIENKTIEANNSTAEISHQLTMVKDKAYPIELLFYYSKSSPQIGEFGIAWEWEGQEKSIVPGDYLFHTDVETDGLSWYYKLDEIDFDSANYLKAIGVKNSIVYYEKDGFGAWPANSGIWSWGDEILVGFSKGSYKKNFYHHSLDNTKPNKRVFARSTDGGNTWIIDESIGLPRGDIKSLKKPIDFSHSDLAVLNSGDRLYYSYDRGYNWNGPFHYPDFNIGPYTSRTDYVIDDPRTCKMFLSAKYKGDKQDDQDRSFMALSTDGGKTFEFVSWIAETDTLRSVMSSTVKVSDQHYISALRRRYDAPRGINNALYRNWIDVYESTDNGNTWTFLNKIADTDKGRRNGNPPSLVRLSDGMLCVIYGYRALPYSVRARTSTDNGKTWSKEIIVRDDAAKWDLGYVRTVVRPDDKIVMVYYFTSHDVEEQHIEATIWDPKQVEEYNKSK